MPEQERTVDERFHVLEEYARNLSNGTALFGLNLLEEEHGEAVDRVAIELMDMHSDLLTKYERIMELRVIARESSEE